MKYHHLGIPTTTPQPGETYLAHEILIEPNEPSPGVKVAFVLVDGAPVEFLEYEKK